MPQARTSRILLVIAVLLGLTELSIRLFADASSQWNVRLGTIKRFDPVTQFRLKSNWQIAPGVRTNENGFLAPPGIGLKKPADRKRLIYLGDSVTVLPPASPYPVVVERLLSDAGLAVETLNAAVPGYSTRNARALFESELSRYEGDYFFVNLGWNDLGQYGPDGLPYKRALAGYELNPMQRVLTQIYTLRLLYALPHMARRLTPSVDEPLSPEDQERYASYYPTHYEENLRAILARAKSLYPTVAIMRLATITNPNPTAQELQLAHYPTGMDKNMRKLHMLVLRYNEVVDKVAAEQDVPRIDLFALFDSEDARREFTDSCHLTREGAQRAGRALAEFVLAHERRTQAIR